MHRIKQQQQQNKRHSQGVHLSIVNIGMAMIRVSNGSHPTPIRGGFVDNFIGPPHNIYNMFISFKIINKAQVVQPGVDHILNTWEEKVESKILK